MDDMNIHESYPAPQHPDGSDASGFTLGNVPMPKADPRGYYPLTKGADGKTVYSDQKALKRDGN